MNSPVRVPRRPDRPRKARRRGPGAGPRAILRRPRARAALNDAALWLLMAWPLVTVHDVPLLLRVPAAPLLALAAALSRRAPLAAAAVPAALSLAATPELFTSTFSPALVVLSFLLGRRAEHVRPSIVAAAVLCAAGLVAALTLPGADLWDWSTLVTTVVFAAVLPWLLGRFRRQQYELQSAGWELAARMEREQQLVAERTRLRERSRIAGDMHDSLGHDLSLIAVRAAGLQVSRGVDEDARASAAELRQAAADATERLHRIIGLLRQDSSGLSQGAPEITSETVPELVGRTAASGVDIVLHRNGGDAPPEEAPAAPSAPLPPMVDRAVHRVVQEAVTNAMKHAPGSRIAVALRREDDCLSVRVHNSATADASDAVPPDAVPPAPESGSGTGLIGLDERVRQLGGTFRARPTRDGFEVAARLPLTPGPLPRAPADAPIGPSRSQEELAQARRRVHRGVVNVLWIPVAATAALAVLMYGFQIYTSHESVLSRGTYDKLRVGTAESSVTPRLPGYQYDEETRPSGVPPDPADSDECRFYRTATFADSPLYRLCFRDGRLSAKDRVTRERTARDRDDR
ncbi:sensor histidine kinase [Streptomyces sp. AA1529]|uniref:sensor histidine kinase n=1 Tax=Streptomyces sp. AA1529 TaxID=1203257 RepID=UPI001ED8D85F|nr:histidine kinase [Streptomyces sp. AA1529]